MKGFILIEFLLLIIAIGTLEALYEKISHRTSKSSKKQFKNLSTNDDFIYLDKDEPKKSTVNNYYTQKNTYVQQNNYYNNSSKGLTERVWKRLGYSIKYGEKYSYKFYGNEIFTPDQVKMMSTNKVQCSENGLTKKLLSDTKSKKMTKNILVKQYGYSESNAKNLVEYSRF